MKLTKKDECSYSISNAIRTLAMIRLTERQESLLGMSPHFLVFAEKVA